MTGSRDNPAAGTCVLSAQKQTFDVAHESGRKSPILLKNSWLAATAERDSIDFARIDGGDDDGGTIGIAGSVFLPVFS